MSSGAHPRDNLCSLPRQARGFVGMVMLVILVLGALSYIVNGLSQSDIRNKQAEQTRQALALAKDALIARAAIDENRPGTLPCPDRHDPSSDDAGRADSMGMTCVNADLTQRQYFVGRLPWKTLGLEDLRDGHGERLWYALSPAFAHRNESGALINSDTPGVLTVRSSDGSDETGVIAMVFSAGSPIDAQTRANPLDPAQYLEQENAGTAGFKFANRRTVTDPAQAGFPFNDQAIRIRHDELFRVVENHAAHEIAAMLRDYSKRWDAVAEPMLPFATAFLPDQPADTFCGESGRAAGLLPVSSACLSWSSISVEVDGDDISAPDCGTAPSNQPDKKRMIALVCKVGHGGGEEIKIKARLRNAGKTLAMPVETSKVKYGSFPDYTETGPSTVSLTHTVEANGHVYIRYRATFNDAGSSTITIPVYSALQRPGRDLSWFIDNEWYRLTYYATIEPLLPDEGGACVPGSADPDEACLTVKGLATPNNDKQALIVLAGRRLAGKTRPSADLTDYLEGDNAGGSGVYERRTTSSKTFNDKLATVLPAP